MTQLPVIKRLHARRWNALALGRRGSLLLETLFAMALLSALAGAVISLLSMARLSDRQGNTKLQQRQEIRRLANDLRHDVRRAEQVKRSGAELLLSNPLKGIRIAYESLPGQPIGRLEFAMDGTKVSEDRYDLGTDTRIEVQWDEDSNLIHWQITLAGYPSEPIEITAYARAHR